MFKLLLSAVFALGVSSIAFADHHEGDANAPAATETTEAEATAQPTDHKDHKAHGKKMNKKAAKKKAEKKEEAAPQ